MKYGEQFEKESVPQWSLHNIDYNSLKHHIKVHTTRDQATAIAIPGRPNTALHKFEDDFYSELCRQHDRVELFVSSKADEIARRLQHLSSQIHRLILRCATSGRNRMSLKRRQRFAKYEQVLLQCGDDIKSLQRFVGAQVVAFRKILKKYRKWTGSSTLGARFKDSMLSNPKSFTKRDFAQLQSHHDDLLQTLHAALPASGVGSPEPEPQFSRPGTAQLSPSETMVDPESQPAAGYWNEYEYGSEAGDFDRNGDDQYAIYIDPNQDNGFPGLKTLRIFFSRPITKLTAWISFHPESDFPTADLERGPLLPTHTTDGYGSTSTPPEPSYFNSPPGGTNTNTTDTDLEDDRTSSSRQASNGHSRRGSVNRGYTSSSDEQMFFPSGYSTHYAALPSVEEQRVVRYRERVLRWGTWGCYGTAFVLMGIAAVLIVAGRQKMRLEVDAGVILGIMASLGLACGGLCMTSSRTDKLGLAGRLAVWSVFVVICVANGVLLVLLMGNAKI
ncbi:SPX domain-containing protein [Chaetomium tenue]|uniref:SPX domain-containing protein n=1 Tax=Chaetomium tenue TaxID=1854479 RepID=A0ACB7NX45_9PEZI|nr:SPX domain-containing protein [Chaetomium globosum]